jgi:hypothetical protein
MKICVYRKVQPLIHRPYMSPPVNTEPTYVSEELNPPLQLVEIKTKIFFGRSQII